MIEKIIFNNIQNIYRRMSHAAMRAGREPSSVRLVGVTKTVGPELIRYAIDSGLRIFGENRVQEAKRKIIEGGFRTISEQLEWHFIGHLQKNKVKDAVQLFDLLHSVDSEDLAATIDRYAGSICKIQRILVQVKLSDERTKHGIDESELIRLIDAINKMQHLKLEGLMTIPPYFENPKDTQPYFRRLRELRDIAEGRGGQLPELSMGMSHDFETAISEGATIIRVGTAIFGERRGI